MEITYSVKHQFFDRESVKKRISSKKRRGLSKAGAIVRTTARQLLGRKVKRPPPNPRGGTPRVRSPNPNLKKILFFYNDQTESVTVGPVRLPGKPAGMPGIHEHGGTSVVRIRNKPQPKIKGKKGKKRKKFRQYTGNVRNTDDNYRKWLWTQKNTKVFRARYPKRPFMATALKKRKRDIAPLFRNLINQVR
jgi:hypothetical protein